MAAILLGLNEMYTHRYASGAIAVTTQWPRETSLSLNSSKRTLLLFIHPQCPCVTTSVEELSRIFAKSGRGVDFQLVVYRPKNEDAAWAQTASVERAKSLGASRRWDDVDGRIAGQFRVTTSGQVLLFDPDGRLLFNGGVTDSRGHAGDNDNAEALNQLLMQPSQEPQLTVVRKVFGCEVTPAVASVGGSP
jgi:hypothetical protein